MSHQVVQHIEGFGRQGHWPELAPETGIVRVKRKPPKSHWGEDIHELLSSSWGIG